MAALAAAGRWTGQVCPPYAVGVRYVNPTAYLKAVAGRLRHGPRRLSVLRETLSESRRGAVGNSLDLLDPMPRLGKFLLEATTAWSPRATDSVLEPQLDRLAGNRRRQQ
jgi:hypothetical protein